MTKILISGLSVGNDFGLCKACGFDDEWLFRYPSIILWVNKILLTKSTWNFILDPSTSKNAPFYKSMRLIFEILHSSGLVEILNPLQLVPLDVNKTIISSVESDVKTLVSRFPDVARLGDDDKVPGQMFLDKDEYCGPHLYSIYASLLLARMLGAECLFNHRVLKYCNYKFGLGSLPAGIHHEKIESFHSVFESLFPNEPLLPEYAIWYERTDQEKTCMNCSNMKRCSDSYLITTETQTKKALSMRNREEIEESRELIGRIIEKRSDIGIEPSEVKDEYLKECERLSRRTRKMFRKIKFWCSLSMLFSVPMTAVGISTQTPSLLAVGAGTLAVSTGLKHLMDSLQEKYRWTAYFNRDYGKGDKPFYLPPPKSRK